MKQRLDQFKKLSITTRLSLFVAALLLVTIGITINNALTRQEKRTQAASGNLSVYGTIKITCPSTGNTYNSNTISVSGTASDDVALSSVQVRVGSSGIWRDATSTTNWNTWSITGIVLANGLNTVYAKATDAAGNFKETSITITYDSTAVKNPEIGNTNWYYGEYSFQSDPRLTWDVAGGIPTARRPGTTVFMEKYEVFNTFTGTRSIR